MTNSGVVNIGHVGDVYALTVQIVFDILAKVILGSLAEESDIYAHFCHLDGSIGGRAADILCK